MSSLKRRDVLCAAGFVALGSSMATGQNARDNQGERPTAEALLAKIKLSAEQRKKSKILPTRGLIPVSHGVGQVDQAEVQSRKLDAVVQDIKGGYGELLAYALRWTCPTNVLNNLQVNGQPLNAQTFSFSVENISWQAGGGWPVYHVYCPRDDYGDANYPHAKIHQIVPSIVDVVYFVGCYENATAAGDRSGQVRFAVNDGGGDYGDNRGTFDVLIYSYT
jgi:hypothetical protein